jgi:pantetheine-phosphate adenylyltransferase
MVRAVYPGTFDPIHLGHIAIAERAARLFEEVVVAVYDRPLKSLIFSPEERIALARQSFTNNHKIIVTGYSGLTIDWRKYVGARAAGIFRFRI